ncbi:MAG: ATP-dependent DNA helicase [Thermodesulfobacteriota bacterium]
MKIAKAILKEFSDLNDAQRKAVGHTGGPLLIIAGPGSGKTLVLIVRALNLLLQGLAEPREILLCTFTEKAAFELRDRLSLSAKKLGYKGNLSELLVGTIHGICNDFLLRYRHRTPLGNNYEVLDELTQLFFIFDHFGEIIGPEEDGKYLGRWTTRWTAIEGARNYFNKITEELVSPDRLNRSREAFIQAIGRAYKSYVEKLSETNRIDFAHQQKLFLQLLEDREVARAIRERVRYVMVDEYQDTNYVQEQLLLRMAGSEKNICVVGDEDQSLYRFRGATVRNILEFPWNFKECPVINLSINYRSHPQIIRAYNKFMSSWDWKDHSGENLYRYKKVISPDPDGTFAEYPSVFAIWGENREDEARRFADVVHFLKKHKVIEDESQIALLLHSVRSEHSGPYLEALAARGISAFCPRARAYFENEEIQFMVGCFAVLLEYYGDLRGEISGRNLQELAAYVDECLQTLAKDYHDPHPLAKCLQKFSTEVASLGPGETLDRRLGDYFYEFIAREPFVTFLKNENRARNLATFSQLLNVFQNYYHYTVITARNREPLRFHFFHSFLRLLYEGGINEYEDPDQPFPKGHVQVMTIHQAKGLEFPVVIVGSLAVQLSSPKDVDRTIGGYYLRKPFEPEDRITGFDRMRLHYVAFSRAEKILVLTTTDHPKIHFNSIWQGLPQWPYVQKNLLRALFFRLRSRMVPKKTFSFSSDLKVYETCPRQYQFFRHYEFMPSRSAEFFFGALVHQTIEEIHRWVLDGKANRLNKNKIKEFFEFNLHHLINRGIRPIGQRQREEAFGQVLNYFGQNKEEIRRVIETEVDVSVEKEDYILTGKIDLLMGGDDKLELLDFKAQPRPVGDADLLKSYHNQLCIYAHILEQRYSKSPDRLLLYWTGEPQKKDALMVFPYRPKMVEEAGSHFDAVVKKIQAKDFRLQAPPESKICKECDIRLYCRQELKK